MSASKPDNRSMELEDQQRREALAKLAKLSAYSAPAVVSLLHPQLSRAQGSIPPGNPSCSAFFFQHQPPGANPGHDFFGDFFGSFDVFNTTDDAGDCGE